MLSLYVPACVGRSTMKQYMPMKPVKRGFKVWVRADAVNGYFCDFDVYVGRPGDGTSVETGLGEPVVKELTETMQGKHYQIFCDNFFSSCTLFDDLLQQGLYAVWYHAYHSMWLSHHTEGDHTGAWEASVLSAGVSGCVSVDGQEACDDVVHIGAARCREVCKEEAKGWDKGDSDLL